MFKNRLSKSIVGSVVLHIVVLLLLLFAPKHHTELHSEPLVVDFIETQPKTEAHHDINNAKMIVDQKNQVNDEISDKAKYLSAFNQTIKKETAAQNFGEFQNANSVTPSQGNTQAAKKGSEQKKSDSKTVKKSLAQMTMKDFMPEYDHLAAAQKKEAFEKSKDEQGDNGTGAGAQASQTRDYLKDVDKGMQTMLSTREFVYYSYYNRIRNQLSQYWEPIIKKKISAIYKQGRTIASTDDKITKVMIILDKKGVLQKVQVLGASGLRDLDDAAVEAFRAAAPFPNPPKGIADEDGTIKIRWDFILEA